MKTNTVKTVVKTAVILLIAVLSVVVSYLLYIVFSYNRIDDALELNVNGSAELAVPINTSLSLVTYNIGFGAYSADYSFFMDGGKHSRAYSKDAVIRNTNGALETIQKDSPSFVLLQEVDTDGTRSYHVDQTALMSNGFSTFEHVFAQNYHSAYFLYPFHEPIGANQSGLMTFSQFHISRSVRRSLPIENSLYKYLDLDRAYTVSHIPAENGKTLVLYNVHLSAYTSDGTIADKQLRMLCEDMLTEYQNGNYVLAAGDFNKDMLGDSSLFFERSEGDFTWAKPFDTSLLPSEFRSYTGSNVPTCRNADSPFRGDGTDFVLSVDGVLASNNIEMVLCETIDTAFAYSDHNPVRAVFKLTDNS